MTTTARLDALRAKMDETGTDLVVLGPGAHLAWLLGVKPHADERPCLAFVSAKGAGFLMPALEAESARTQTDLPFFEWADDAGPEAALAELLGELGVRDAGALVLDETMRADHAALVTDALPGAARRFTVDTVGALRMRKGDDELAALKRNAQIADRAMQAARAAMAPGKTEAEIAAVVRGHFAEAGAKPLFTIIGAGKNGAFPHHQTGETVLRDGDAVVMDIGAASEGYSSDITRMAVIGDGPEGYAEVHAVVEAAVQAALAAARPGVKAREVDDAARGVIAEAGYGEYFVHRTGHGLGTEVHEPPFITASSDTVLDEGMVFSIEPGIYLPGRFGIRLEEIVVLRADGPEILSDLPRDAERIDG
ncbi:Probable dipeptidase PepE [Oceanicola granulosus HTCC2516]|uniref:Probable dipeptidase PepE n=1 Tax=Oceanicola granulosus (strain ATCC BAA-861 / DSM 15982 / KCTC 12143 / HTCC2516) TaxID=314256 RepID=Q2CGR2_OCEGH|nr:Xaa-Pro peptidase family protein [Oceanicola granulosus]EAR51873.1 Probable dipeptidase PepE [Oceanicola granulosus HTCC2516]